MNSSADTSDIERVRRAVGRVGVRIAFALMLLGTGLYFLDYSFVAASVFQAAFCVLILMPAKNVLAVLADEVRRQDWWFALLAVAVLSELVFAGLDQVR